MVKLTADAMEHWPIRCAIELDGSGTVRLARSAGCAVADARELCLLIAASDPVVADVTPECPRYDGRAAEAVMGAAVAVLLRTEPLGIRQRTALAGLLEVADQIDTLTLNPAFSRVLDNLIDAFREK